MESLGLVRREVPGVEGGPQTPVEIASEIPAYSRQAYTGAKWIFIILSSTLLNAFLFGVGVKLHFIFGMAIPLIAQRAGSDLFAKSLFVPAMVWRATAAAVYVLFSFLYQAANKGRAWPGYVVLVIYLLDLLLYVAGRNWIEVLCHVIASGFVVYGVIGATLLRRRLATLRQMGAVVSSEPLTQAS